MDRPAWYDSFFRGCWQAHQLAGEPADKTAHEADLLVRLLELKSASRVLDVPCGEGRHAIELASRGCRVSGVDFNPVVVAAAQERARALGLVGADFVAGDMRDLAHNEIFDAAYCFFGSFGYFDDAGNSAFARAVCRGLRTGGRFLIDTHVQESLLPRFRERDWSWEKDRSTRLLQERTVNLETGRIDCAWTWVAAGVEKERGWSSIRLYSYRDLSALLRDAGFSACAGFDHAGAAFRVGAPRLCMLATK
jgi:SAM-dependent methyltransferase